MCFARNYHQAPSLWGWRLRPCKSLITQKFPDLRYWQRAILMYWQHLPCLEHIQLKFSLAKNSQPTCPCITEIFHGINFHPCSKDCHRLYVIINMGQKVHRIKNSHMKVKVGDEEGKNFLQAKISSYEVVLFYFIHNIPRYADWRLLLGKLSWCVW